MRRSLEALDEGRAEHAKAVDIEADWQRAAREFRAWLAALEPTQRVRWTAVADARRADVARSLSEAADYVNWWETEMERLRQVATAARAAWRREQSRLDALQRRADAERRRAANLEEEVAFQELADAAATGRSRAGAR
ncbi:MAG: hypothetical protein RJA99_3823 [Pseudomonadota bacterium]